MTAETAQREPTMEEILASIRRIISEEDQPDTGGGVLELAQPFGEDDGEEAYAEEAMPLEEDEFDMEAAMRDIAPSRPAAPPVEDLIIMEDEDEPAPPPVARQVDAPRPVFTSVEEGIVEDTAAQLAAGSLYKLMGSMSVSNDQTLDGIVRSLLKPMLKEWLDANLPQVVETVVQKEVDRIRRMAR